MNRRNFIESTFAFAAAPSLLAQDPSATVATLTSRPASADRKFSSKVIEDVITHVQAQMADKDLAHIFSNCFPNTLDTTVVLGQLNGKADTFIVTGDIDAMWLRDSSAQIFPYISFAESDPKLALLIEGAIHRLTHCILLDPYANAFTRSLTKPPLPWAIHDKTEMKSGVAERKWEIDSLCYPIRLAHRYWKTTGSTVIFDNGWQQAARLILETFKQQQRLKSQGPYSFQRLSENPNDSVALNGFGNPSRPNGLIHSAFRPSDDATIFPLFIPANLFAIAVLEQIAEISSRIYSDNQMAADCDRLANSIRVAVKKHGLIQHSEFGLIYAYEVDGYGGINLMDDANAPSLLSLGYLLPSLLGTAPYSASRNFALSDSNPYFFSGSAAEGIGGPHIGLNYIWPMSIIMRAMTSTSDSEIRHCLRALRDTTAGTHFMHETFHKDNPDDFTRPWFAWANTLFGELILYLVAHKPYILREPLERKL